jgi:hypothetical protein
VGEKVHAIDWLPAHGRCPLPNRTPHAWGGRSIHAGSVLQRFLLAGEAPAAAAAVHTARRPIAAWVWHADLRR